MEEPETTGPGASIEPATPGQPSPVEPSRSVEEKQRRRRRGRLIAGLIVGALVLIVGGALVTNNIVYDQTFNRIFNATETAEKDQIWLEYFQDQDCFLDAALESGDIDLVIAEGSVFRETADRLASHVTNSLDNFVDIQVFVLHDPLAAARDAIIAHYAVWDGHLGNAIPILGTLDAEGQDIAVALQAWVDVLVADVDPIEQTFNDAEKLFLDAARGADDIDLVDALFTEADIVCARGAV
jgi:hypothetical protein